MVDAVIVAEGCNCESCKGYNANFNPACKDKFKFTSAKKDFKFPTVVNPTPDKFSNYSVIITIFQEFRLSPAAKLKDAEDVIWHLTYIDLETEELVLKDYVYLCDYLHDVNLDAVIHDEKFAADFLRRITCHFVMTWYSVAVAGDTRAEWAARRFRKLLTHMLGSSIICRQVKNVFCSPEYWPVVTPLDIFESFCKHHMFCSEALSLLVNVTRIDSMCSEIKKSTECLKYIQDQYTQCCARIQSPDDSGGLMLWLFMNITCIPEFLQFLVESNGGYFMNVILVDLIGNPSNNNGYRSIAWPFLRNLALLEKGREQIIINLELFLGHVLYPIAGPEALTDEECENLPLEVQLLPETKKRVEEKRVKECILDIIYSLCRYKKDRMKLRDANVYHILKHYHKVETDESLLEKLENVVNVLIRHEGSEIEVDDLLEGLKVEDKEPPKSTANDVFTPPVPLTPMNRTQNQPPQPRKPESRTESNGRNFKINLANVFIDDDYLETENLCTSEFIPEETSIFSYYGLHEFHRLRKLLYHVKKQKRIIQSSKTSSTMSEEFSKKKFFEMYGPVRFDDPFMKSRWETVKDTINEIKTQPTLNELTCQLLAEEIEDEDLTQVEQVLEDAINQKCSTGEQHQFKNLNPHLGKGDWFKLPRPNLSSIRLQYFPPKTAVQHAPNSNSAPSKLKNSNSSAPLKVSDSSSNQHVDSKVSEENRAKLEPTSSKKPLTNLHVYDPKFEFCYKPPFLVFRREIETIEVPKLQSVRILEHVDRFPLGVSIDMFWEKFYKVHDYLPRLPDVPRLDTLLSLYDQEIYFVRGIDKLPPLIFPKVLEGVVHPEQILKRVWHLIKCVFGSQKCPWIFTEDLLDAINHRYHMHFDPLDWDFRCVNDFLTFCILNFGCMEKLAVYRQNYTEDHVSKFKDFLIINSEFLKDQIAMLYGVTKTEFERRKPPKPMPKNVVQSVHVVKSKNAVKSKNDVKSENDVNSENDEKSDGTIRYIANGLTPGKTYDLDIKTIHNHNHLSCVIVDEYNDLWAYHESLQEGPLRFKFDMEKHPDPDHLIHGTYVMAFRGFQRSKLDPKWFRAKILGKHPTLDKYNVYSIDFGFIQYVERKDLRYMPLDEIPDKVAQSIPIELSVQNPLTEDWNKDAAVDAFTKLLKEFDYLRATFVVKKIDDTLGCSKWVVKDAILYKNDHKKRYHRKFARVFLREYKRRFELRRKRKENAKDGSKAKKDNANPETPDAPIPAN